MIDTHTHLEMNLENGQLTENTDEKITETIKNAEKYGVTKIITIGTTLTRSKKAIQIAQNHKNIFCTIGTHPDDAKNFSETEFEKLLKKSDKIVAIGECGLEIHDEKDRKTQIHTFETQIHIAKKHNLPLVIHSRGNEAETLKILQKHNIKNAVFHCFTGNLDILAKIIAARFFISIGGIVTFKNGKNVHQIAHQTPLSQLLLETDAPFLAPAPHRGKPNQSAFLPHTATEIAKIHNIPVEKLAQITTKNAENFFGI